MNKQPILVFILLLMYLTALAQSQVSLSTRFGAETLSRIIPAPMQFHPIPTANNDLWRSLPTSMRNDYIKYGESFKDKTWDKIPDTVFAEFKNTGNRSNYERPYLQLRHKMAALAMAEIMEQRKRFIKDIILGIHYYKSEVWWGVPAHYSSPTPKKDLQTVDLFNAETANLLAWTIYMLHDELEQEEPGICESVRKEIDRRLLTPARTTNYSWKKATNNWNPWICSNWLACILFCEENRQEQIEGVCQVLQCLDTFFDAYADDGGCDEGIAYWDRAAASYFECLQLIELATNGNITMRGSQKLSNMAAFVYRTYIGNDLFVNFSDTSPLATIHPNIAIPFGQYVGDSLLTGYAMKVARKNSFPDRPSVLYQKSGNYPALSRELMFLSQYQSHDLTLTEPLKRDSWLEGLQVFTARSTAGTTEGLFVAAKGGHNNESHNHNDVGNFIVYIDAKPILIDIGVGTYTAQTFSKKRYELFNCRAAYHNVPLVNGYEQHEGKEYAADNVHYQNNNNSAIFSLDIAQTYPKEANVKQWKRTIKLNRGQEVVVTEDYKLLKYLAPSEIILICCGEAYLYGDNNIVINNGENQGVIQFDPSKLSPTIEKINYQDNIVYNLWKKRTLNKIKLTLKSHKLKNIIKYSIRPYTPSTP